MRGFLFSRKFWIPFLVTLLLYLLYFVWEFWNLYKADFNGKQVPFSASLGFLFYSAAALATNAYFLAILTGVSYFFHQILKKSSSDVSILYKKSFISLLIIVVAGFYYVSFVEPNCYYRNVRILSSVVMMKPGDKFIMDTISYKNERMMTLPELLEVKRQAEIGKMDSDFSLYANETKLKKINWQIWNKISYPVNLLLLCLLATLLGISLRRTKGIVVLILAFIILFTGFYYSQKLFEFWYNKGKIEFYLGIFGTAIIMLIVYISWHLIIRKAGYYKNESQAAIDDLLEY